MPPRSERYAVVETPTTRDLMNPEVAHDGDRLREVIAGPFQEFTGVPLDYKIRIVSTTAEQSEAFRLGTIGTAYQDYTEVHDQEKVPDLLFAVFHELGHYLDIHHGDRIQDRLVQAGLMASYEPADLGSITRTLAIIEPGKGEVFSDGLSVLRMDEETRAHTFSLQFAEKIMGPRSKVFRAMVEGFLRDRRHDPDGYDSGSGYALLSSLPMIPRLIEHGGDVSKLHYQLGTTNIERMAQTLDVMLTSSRLKPLMKTSLESLAAHYHIRTTDATFALLDSERTGLDSVSDPVRKMLKRVAKPGFDQRLQAASDECLSDKALPLLAAVVAQDPGRVISAIETSYGTRQPDRIAFLIAQQMEVSNPVVASELYRYIVKQYPKSEYRFKAQHR